MSNLKQTKLIQMLIDARNDPTRMQDIGLDTLDRALNGSIEIPDANNPFIYALEFASMTASAIMQNHEDLTTKRYPVLSQSYSDLYNHMSDEDYGGRFGEPSRIPVAFVFNADEVRKRAVPVQPTGAEDEDSVYSKLVIPRNSSFEIIGITFSLEYPIEIRVMKHGGFVVVYDVSEPSPLLRVETNQIEWRIINSNNNEYIRIDVPLRQFKATPYYDKITDAGGFKATYPLDNDSFYYVRVFTRSTKNDPWAEARVTHSDLIYDANVLTFTAKVLENTVVIRLPEVYVNNRLGVGQVRVDVYTTKGELLLETVTVKSSSIKAVWADFNYEHRVLSPYSTPLSVFAEKTMEVIGGVTGGKNAMAVAELRDSVIYQSNKTDLPVTPEQLEYHLDKLGYDTLKAEEVPTKRTYQATRSLPIQTNKGLSTAVGVGIVTIQESMDQLVTRSSVRDNGNRVTITPEALYEVREGRYHLMLDNEVGDLTARGPDELARAINSGSYYYSPFYYTLDANDNLFDTRVYALDTPTIPYKTFVYENNSVGVELVIDKIAISRSPSGYDILCMTSSDDFYKNLNDEDVACQMMFTPQRESQLAYLNGRLVGRTAERERMWLFSIDTNFDLTKHDELVLTSFAQFGNDPSKLRAALTDSFTIISCIATNKSPNDPVFSEADSKLGKWYFEKNMLAVTEQSYEVKFGDALTYMYTRSRSVVSEKDVQRYEENIPWRYPADVYKRKDGMLVFDEHGKPILEHKKGEIMVDAEGVTMFRYRQGDVKRDKDGNPIPLNDRVILREVDIVCFDGNYYFTTNQLDKDYIAAITDEVVGWLVNDLTNLNKRLLERTFATFRPKQSLGIIDVITNAKEERQIEAALEFEVTYYLTDTGFKNTNLRKSLTSITPKVISEVINRATFGRSDILSALREYITDEVVDIELPAFGHSKDINVITVKDATMRCAIRKKLSVTTDAGLTVNESVDVMFAKHKDMLGRYS
ncbi:hypothetical protein [Proteus columbae]|uniref:hypothetical protein n=1 Tax=Proteus columbae TaxID=1987580 RepID=UPI00288AD490|nr:hypothetical protein [Proteus columbae]